MGLKDKASRINFASLPGVAPHPTGADSAVAGARPKTAPGFMMAHASDQRSVLLRESEDLKAKVSELSVAAGRAAELQDELSAWEGAKATRLIDTRLVARSRWANRDERHFLTPEFEQLKSEIASANGNVQPIKVRPLPAADGSGARFELVYGHRRCEACQQLGLPVLALVDNLDDRSLFVEMDRENRSRKDLSAWEQGVMYRRALKEGLFPSNRKLAEAVGADLTNVGRALALADLPPEVVQAFGSPLELQYRWARPLTDAWEADAAAVKKRAAGLVAATPRPAAKEVFERLMGSKGQGGSTVLPPATIEVQIAGKRAALVSLDSRGAAKVAIEPGMVLPARLGELATLLERFLTQPKGKAR